MHNGYFVKSNLSFAVLTSNPLNAKMLALTMQFTLHMEGFGV